ncbi:MAG: hypothetical protein JWP67_371 [Mucilaginibacter sp.]|nr:hypothetical protein [Mucilaginibacter sp.]
MKFKLKLKVGLLVTVAMLSFTATAQKNTRNFVWGINGHPLTQKAYSNNLADQIQSLNDLKVNSYRFDVLMDPFSKLWFKGLSLAFLYMSYMISQN